MNVFNSADLLPVYYTESNLEALSKMLQSNLKLKKNVLPSHSEILLKTALGIQSQDVAPSNMLVWAWTRSFLACIQKDLHSLLFFNISKLCCHHHFFQGWSEQEDLHYKLPSKLIVRILSS